MPLEANKCIPLRCQAIASIPGQDEDDAHCLCAISWYSFIHKRNKLLLFDLNQWYKDEMPVVVDASKSLNYLAGYICAEELSPPSRQDFMEQAAHGRTLDSWLHKETITHFHSIQRLEEHFYPNSLSFGKKKRGTPYSIVFFLWCYLMFQILPCCIRAASAFIIGKALKIKLSTLCVMVTPTYS